MRPAPVVGGKDGETLGDRHGRGPEPQHVAIIQMHQVEHCPLLWKCTALRQMRPDLADP